MTAARAQVWNHQHRECEGEDADRNVHGEDRAPAEVGHQETANGWAGDDREAGKHSIDGKHASAPLRREERNHQGQALGCENRGTKTLRRA